MYVALKINKNKNFMYLREYYHNDQGLKLTKHNEFSYRMNCFQTGKSVKTITENRDK